MDEELKKDVSYYQFVANENNEIKEKMVLMNIDGEEKEKVLKILNEKFSKTGKYFEKASEIKNIPIPLLLKQIGEEKQLSSDSTPIFMVSNNPENLMKLREINYSADMKDIELRNQLIFLGMVSMATLGTVVTASSGPFILPVLVNQISTTLFFLWKLSKIEKELIRIGIEIEKLLKRDIAKDISYFSSSLKTLKSLENEFLNSQKFTDDMTIRLNLIENKVRKEDEKQWTLIQEAIFEYDEIYEIIKEEIKDSKERKKREKKLKEKMEIFNSKVKIMEALDTKLWLSFSILSIRIMILRNKLILQQNSQYSEKNINNTKNRMEEYRKKWQKLVKLHSMLKAIKQLEAMNKNIGKERTVLKEGLERILNGIDVKEIEKLLKEIDIFLKEKKESEKYSLIYWKDELGEHSYCIE